MPKINRFSKTIIAAAIVAFLVGWSGCKEAPEAAYQKCLISIEGMTCSSCKNTVEEALKSTEGVLESSVNLDEGTAEVTFDPSKIDGEKIAAAVSETGYEAQLE